MCLGESGSPRSRKGLAHRVMPQLPSLRYLVRGAEHPVGNRKDRLVASADGARAVGDIHRLWMVPPW